MWPAGKKTMVNQHNLKNILKKRLKYFHIWEIEKHFWKQAKVLAWEKSLNSSNENSTSFYILPSDISQKKICTFKQSFFYSPSPQNKFWNIKWLFIDWKKISCPFQIWSDSSTLEKHFLRRATHGDTVPQSHTLEVTS